jgi:hypothetical protein
MSILRRKVSVKKNKNEEEKIANFEPEQEPESQPIEKQVDMKLQEEENNVVMDKIKERKEQLKQERNQLKTLESKIKQHCSEIEALEYIASGEPTMAIIDLLNMIQDFKEDAEKYETPKEIMEEIEKTIMDSTIESING